MINKHFTYINTSNSPAELVVTALVDGENKTFTINLKENQVSPDINNEIKSRYNKAGIIQSVNVNQLDFNSAGKPVMTQKSLMGETFDSKQDILKKSVILDIETTTKVGGAGITQIGLYDIGDKKANLFIPKVNLLAQEELKGTEKSFKKSIAYNIDLPDDMTFKEVKKLDTAYEMLKAGEFNELGINDIDAKSQRQVYEQLLSKRQEITTTYSKQIDDYMVKTDRFQALLFAEEEALQRGGIQLNNDQILKRGLISKMISGEVETSDIDRYLRETLKVGTDVFEGGFVLHKGKSLRDIINNDMPKLLEGKVTWIANAAFESKQFGAQIRAFEQEAFDALKSANMIETSRRGFSKAYQSGVFASQIDQLNETLPEGKKLVKYNPFIDVLEGVSASTGDPFYVTGSEYGMARNHAFKTGDFTKLYDVFLNHTKSGSVRDIQDLVRMQQSFFYKQGMMKADKPVALSIEVQARLAAFSERMRLSELATGKADFEGALEGLFEKETHIAIGDVLSEEKVLRESFEHLDALSAVSKGDTSLVKLAQEGKGAYFRAAMVGHLQDYLNRPAMISSSGEMVESLGLEDILLRQRAGRMFEDIAEQGFTEGAQKYKGYGVAEQLSRTGGLTTSKKVPINKRSTERLFTFQDVVDDLNQMNHYKSVDRDRFMKQMENQFKEYFDESGNLIEGKKTGLLTASKQLTESASNQIQVFEERFRGQHSDFTSTIKKFAGMVDRPEVSVRSSIDEQSFLKSVREGVAYRPSLGQTPSKVVAGTSIFDNISSKVGAYGLLAGALFVASHYQEQKDKGILVSNYQEFLNNQAKYFGNIDTYVDRVKDKYGMKMEGLQHQGIMAKIRSTFTDFGSPYNGPGYSSFVLEDNKLRQERNNYYRQQFNVRHFSEQGDIGLLFKMFLDSSFRKEYGLVAGSKSFFAGDPLDTQRYNMLRDQKNLRQKIIRKNEFDINVEDGDTITLQRKGSDNSALSRFMGNTGGTFSFRLAGIDSPETAHGDRPAQPYAEASKKMLQDIVNKGQDVRLIMRPDDTTYGRQVAMLYVDGKNINLEMIKRGMASYLPYKSKGKRPMFDQKAFEKAQESATKSKRGMWSTSYFQAYSEIVKGSGETITFNTLANRTKVAKSANLMSVYSIMNEANKVGMTGLISQEIAGLSERLKYTQKISDRSVFTPDAKMSNYDIPSLQAYGGNPNTILSSLDQIKYDLAGQINNSFSNIANENKQRNVNNLKLSKESLNASQIYKEEAVVRNDLKQQRQLTKVKRMKRMETMQHNALGNIFNSPIQHHRM